MLLIDDDPAILDSVTLLLEVAGYRVVTASDAQDGLAAFQTLAPAVVITDIFMPTQDGLGAIREMRRLRPDAKIVAMSGRVEALSYVAEATKAGADIAIDKTDSGRLLEVLPKLLTDKPTPAR